MPPLFPSPAADGPDADVQDQRQLLPEQKREMQRARGQFAEEQRLLRAYWRSRHTEEWERLRAEAKRVAASAARQRRDLQGKMMDVELRRRELEVYRREF